MKVLSRCPELNRGPTVYETAFNESACGIVFPHSRRARTVFRRSVHLLVLALFCAHKAIGRQCFFVDHFGRGLLFLAGLPRHGVTTNASSSYVITNSVVSGAMFNTSSITLSITSAWLLPTLISFLVFDGMRINLRHNSRTNAQKKRKIFSLAISNGCRSPAR